MTRTQIRDMFRNLNPKITSRVITNTILNNWLLVGNKEFCAETRCVVDQDGTIISTSEDDTFYDLTAQIPRFYDIDSWPASGVLYNNKKLTKSSMAELDTDSPTWRDRGSGTPKKYYRRGPYLYLDRPINSDAEDIKVYSVLIPNDFDGENKTPYDELTYLEPYHFGLVLYLTWRAKEKVDKKENAAKAQAEYNAYVKKTKKMIGGGKYSPIYIRPRTYPV